jgi:hypothetical protein
MEDELYVVISTSTEAVPWIVILPVISTSWFNELTYEAVNDCVDVPEFIAYDAVVAFIAYDALTAYDEVTERDDVTAFIAYEDVVANEAVPYNDPDMLYMPGANWKGFTIAIILYYGYKY